jgi:hypothetical protein
MKKSIFHFQSKIFLIDGLGALLTAILLGFVLTNFQEYIGMPIEILIPLAIIALGLCFYSLSCYLLLKRNWRPFMRALTTANLLYCLITGFLIFTYFNQLTLLGTVYFAGEIMVIGVLVFVELSMLNKRLEVNDK